MSDEDIQRNKKMHANYELTRDVARTTTSDDTEDQVVNAVSLLYGVFGKSTPLGNWGVTLAGAGVNGYNYLGEKDYSLSNKLALIESAGQIAMLSPLPNVRAGGYVVSVTAGTLSIMDGATSSKSNNTAENTQNQPTPNHEARDRFEREHHARENARRVKEAEKRKEQEAQNKENQDFAKNYEKNNPGSDVQQIGYNLTNGQPIYRVELPDGRVVYTDNPMSSKLGKQKDEPQTVDSPNTPDWKEDINPNDWRDKPNRQGKHYFYDPIVLDLDGDGIETLAHNKNKGAMFDFDADGLKHVTGWVKSDDGILVFDRNADGLINDGREVFGDSTLKADGSLAKHGFDALADLDSNADGYINQDDDAYKLLKVWQDKNQDGLSQADELKTLEELGIQSLNLSYQDTKQNLNGGNELAQIGSYTKTDGTTFKMGDVNFKFDSLYSQHSLAVDITDIEIAFLPNLAGGGRVRSLHEAMQLSAELKDILIQYAQATTKQAQLELLPSLLKAWAKTDPDYQDLKIPNLLESVQSNDGTGVAIIGAARKVTLSEENADKIHSQFQAIAHKVGVLDSFLGTKTENLYYHSEQNAKETIDLINKTYDDLSTAIYSGLYGQGGMFNHYNQYVQLHISFDDEQNIQYKLNFAPLIQHFQQKIATGDEQQLKTAFIDLIEYINHFQKQKMLQQYDIKDVIMLLVEFSENINIEQQTEWLNEVNPHILKQGFIKFGADTNDNITASIVIAKDGNDRVYGTEQKDFLLGGLGNDYVEARQGDDYIDGGDGNDALYGENGSDTLIGGTGNDHLDGALGADTYIFSKGHGQDTIHDYDWTTPNGQRPQDKVIFTDVRSDEIQIELNGEHLIIKGYHEQDQITLLNFTRGEHYHIEQFEFADKTVSLTELLSERKISGTAHNDNLSFSYWATKVILDGADGNDNLYGGQLNDTLIGGLGNDYLYGGNGADTAVLQMLDLTHHHIDYFADFNLKQGDKLDIRDLLEQPNQTIDLSNLSDYFSTEKTNNDMVLKFDQDGHHQDQHQSQAIMRFQSNAFDSLDQLIQANSFIL